MVMKIKTFLTIVLIILASKILKAEINTTVSIDWLTVDADCILRGKVISIKVQQNIANSESMTTIKMIVLSEKLKGGFYDPMGRIKGNINDTIVFHTPFYSPSWKPEIYQDKVVLVFLKILAEAHNPILFQLISAKNSYANSIIDLQYKDNNVINGHFNVLKSEKEILEYVSQIVTKTKDLEKGNIACLEVLSDSEANKILYWGSSCYIWVPNNLYPDAKLKCF
jgi:hypothetical protein